MDPFPRSFSRLRPSSTLVQIPLRSQPAQVLLLVSDPHAFESEEAWHQRLHRQYLHIEVYLTWGERSVPRLTCVPQSGMNDRSIIDLIYYIVK